MEDKNNDIALYQIVMSLFQTYFKLFNEIISLAGLEAKLAKQSLIRILILLSVGGVVLAGAWCSLLAVMVSLLLTWHLSWLSAFTVVLLFNLIVLFGISLRIARMKKNLFFQATREQLASWVTLSGESE